MITLEDMIRSSAWAPCLSEAELQALLHEVFERQVPAGGYAIRRGEPADFWLGVIDGLVKMSVSEADGRLATFTGVTAGGWAGEGSLLKPGVWGYDGVAVRDCRLACVPRYSFERLVASNLAFNHHLLGQLNARLSLFVGLVEFDRLLGPDARVARCLASLFDPVLYPLAGDQVKLSQEEVGLLSGLSRQRANQALRTLERGGLLRIGFAGITVLDLAGLRTYDAPHGASAHAPHLPRVA
jgi:CRP/FNR family transcriptional regulator, cyclic AMP receptor protein